MAGHKDIEGLLPDRIRSKIFSMNPSLVTQAIGGDRSAKNTLKKLYLDEFKKNTDYSAEELKDFNLLFKRINKGIRTNKRV
jgi:hypothetical protein